MDFSSPLEDTTAARPLVVADDGEQSAKNKHWSWLFRGAVKSTMMPSSCTNRDSYNAPPSLLDDALPQEIIFFHQRAAPPPEAGAANPNDDDQQEEGGIIRSPSLLLACRGPEQLLGSFLGQWGQHDVNEPTDGMDVFETADIESFVFALRNFRQNNTTTTTSLRKQQILATISIMLVVVVAAYYLSVAATSPDDEGGSPRHHSWFRFP